MRRINRLSKKGSSGFYSLVGVNRWDEKAGLRRDAVGFQVIDALEAQEIRRPAMKKVSTAAAKQSRNFPEQKLTIATNPRVFLSVMAIYKQLQAFDPQRHLP